MLVVVNGGFKTGSSWLWAIADQMLPDRSSVPQYFSSPEWFQDTIQQPLLRDALHRISARDEDFLVKSHFSAPEQRDLLLAHPNTRVLDITRDPRDVVVSWYYHDKSYDGVTDDFETYFWQSGEQRIRRTLSYYRTWATEHPHLHRIEYSNLHDDFDATVEGISSFLGITATPSMLATIKEQTDFATQRKNNPKHFRKGVRGDWESHLDAKMLATIERVEREVAGMPAKRFRGVDVTTLASDLACSHRRLGGSDWPPLEPEPLITVVTPVLNDASQIAATIESVLEQDWPRIEYVVMDGGSTDGTPEIISSYSDRLTRWHSGPDSGHADAVNRGFASTSGQIMCWLNSGDMFYPGALRIAASVMFANPEVAWLQGRPNFLDPAGATVAVNPRHNVWSWFDYLAREEPVEHIQQEATFWRRELWEVSGGALDEEYSLANDLELWQRFFRFSSLQNIDAMLGGFRIHDGQRSVAQRAGYDAEARRVLHRERDRLGVDLEGIQQLRSDARLLPPLRHNHEELSFERNIDPAFNAKPPWQVIQELLAQRRRLQKKFAKLQPEYEQVLAERKLARDRAQAARDELEQAFDERNLARERAQTARDERDSALAEVERLNKELQRNAAASRSPESE